MTPRATGQSSPTPRTTRPVLQKSAARYPRARLGSDATPLHSFKLPQAGEAFTPRRFRLQESVGDSIREPMAAGQSDAFELQDELLLQSSRIPALGHDAFGIPSQELNAARNAIESRFQAFYQRAMDRQSEKSGKSSYEQKTRTGKNSDGTEWQEPVWERRQARKHLRLQAWQAEKGRKIQTGLNKVGRVMRNNRPRKTGTNYVTDKAKDDLLNGGKQVVNDYAAGSVAFVAALNQVPANTITHVDPELATNLGPVADALAVAPLLPAIADAGFGAAALLGLHSELAKAKEALNLKSDAYRFFLLQAEATPEEAENYLKFMAASGKLFEPTLEDASIKNAAELRVGRAGVGVPLAGATAAAIEITSSVVSIVPGVNILSSVGSAITGFFEVHEGKHELWRRRDQKERAEDRKARMTAVLAKVNGEPTGESLEGPAKDDLFEGLVNCLNAQQDRLISQATREKEYAKGRIFKAGGAVGAGVGAITALGALAGVGALTVATGGAALALGAPIVAAWGGAVAARNHKRARDEHTSKWRQRAMRVMDLEMSREELEQKLAGKQPEVEVYFQEGDYVPSDQRFHGSREMKFDARDNEYLGLHVLALQVQDMVGKSNYDSDSPYVQLLRALDIDAVKLLAICKAASGKRGADVQLDFIKSHLAPALGMKLRMEGSVQALPHVSVFLKHFDNAWSKVRGRLDRIDFTPELGADIRMELAKHYPDPSAGLQAFDKAIGTFLDKTQQLPQADISQKMFMGLLKDVVDAAPLVAKREIESPGGKVKASKLEADLLIKQLERFGHPTPRPVAVTPRIPRGG
jgi:hypothetical protein